MDDLTPAEILGRAADLLTPPLREFVLLSTPGSGLTWEQYLAQRDRVDGRPQHIYSLDDPRVLLKILAFHWRHLDGRIRREQSNWAFEIHRTLNTAAHDRASVSPNIARRCLENMALLAEALVPLWSGRDQLALWQSSLGSAAAAPRTEAAPAEPSPPESAAAPTPAEAVDDTSAAGIAPASDPEAPATPDAPETPEVSATPEAPETPEESAAIPDEWEEVTDRADLPEGIRRVRLHVGAALVEAVYFEAINYSLACQGILPLIELACENTGTEGTVTIDLLTLDIDGISMEDGAGHLRAITLQAGQRQVFGPRDIAWHLDDRAFASLTQARPGHLRLNAVIDDHLSSIRGEIRLLAHNEWAARPRPELISAFVSPNHPALASLLDEACELLRQRTGSPSLQGYQADTDRVLAIADAVFDAIAAWEIRYVESPASFERTGQKVRRPETVLGERFGNCLDLSVLYASALEAAGLNPVIVLTRDHAFSGFLAEDNNLSELAVTAPESLQTLVRSGLVVPVEMTVASQGDSRLSRAEATRTTERFWDQDLDDVVAMIDVAACRRRIHPLPMVTHTDEGTVIVKERAAPMALPLASRTPEDDTSPRTLSFPPRVARWRNALLDLSFRNPLLKLATTSGETLHVPERALPRFEDILASNHPMKLTAGLGLDPLLHQGSRTVRDMDDDSVDRIISSERAVHALKNEEALGKALDRLRRKAAAVQDETGANALFVTLGVLKWKDNQGNDALAPLYLLPVRLEGRSGTSYRIRLAGDEVALPNYCLIHKLRRDHDLDIPVLETPPRDDAGIDIPAAFTAIRRAIAVSGKPFAVESHVRLAILQFSTLEMWRDVGEHWDGLAHNPVVRHLIETPTEPFVDPVADPGLTEESEVQEHLPVPSDGSQLKAVRWARAGRTFVLEGPPGTGKSQTITNMIANCLTQGQSVLFVAEKQAALDVVRRRLDASGLAPLTLDLHGRDLTVKKVRAKLEESWNHLPGATAGYRERRAALGSLVRDLTTYRDQLHGEGPAGSSLWSAHEAALAMASHLAADIEVPRSVVRGDRSLSALLLQVETAQRALLDLGEPLVDNPWCLVGPSDEPVDDGVVERTVTALGEAVAALSPQAQRLLRATGPGNWPTILQSIDHLGGNAVLLSDRARTRGREWARELTEVAGALDEFAQRYGPFMDTITAPARTADVSALRSQLHEAQAAGVFKRGRLVASARQAIQAFTVSNSLSEEELHPFLNQLEQFQRDGQALYRRTGDALPGSRSVEHGGHDARTLASHLELSLTMRRLFEQDRAFDAYLDAAAEGSLVPSDEVTAIRGVLENWSALKETLRSTPTTLRTWRGERPVIDAIAQALPRWHEAATSGRLGDLRRARVAQTALETLRRSDLADLADKAASQHVPAETLRESVSSRFAAAILTERLDTTGLDRFHAARRAQQIEALTRTMDAARREAAKALSGEIRGVHDIDTEHPTLELAALRREFQRRSGGSIRELVSGHAHALLKLTPCVLVSPGSVARYLPADMERFDLVIFDEASQIRVADAVGALGRAKSAVIVGDSKQMPPTSMFASQDSADAEEAVLDGLVVPQDQDSILKECVDSNIERLSLTWHYRSQDESLISFSNRTYYDGRLASFPAQPTGESTDHRAVSLTYVGGTFDGGRGGSRTNVEEAEAIVEAIETRLAKDPHESIGVVTFNAQQQDLLLEMLEPKTGLVRDALNRDVDPLFVKNLENVQGDERDVVLFSLAFSPDTETGRLRLNFGPLTREGGERRLNVAVTRARREIVLYSSFQPEHLDFSRTSSAGLRDLRAYMQFARGDSHALDATSTPLRPMAHREDVAAALRGAGLEVVEGLGLSDFKVDLAVRAPDSPAWVAVLLDGPDWKKRVTVSDRDVLPRAVLHGVLRWPRVEQLWLPEWITQRDAAVRRIVDAAESVHVDSVAAPAMASSDASDVPETLPADAWTDPAPSPARDGFDEAPANPSGTSAAATSTPAAGTAEVSATSSADEERGAQNDAAASAGVLSRQVAVDVLALPFENFSAEEPDEGPRGIRVVDFMPAASTPVLDATALDRLHERDARAMVKARIDEVIASEAPVEVQRLARLVGHSFGNSRMRQARVDALLKLVPRAQQRRDGDSMYLWGADGASAEYALVRRDSGQTRAITEIPQRELANALLLTVADLEPVPERVMRRRALSFFGFRTEGSRIRERLDAALARLEAEVLLTRDAEGFRLSRDGADQEAKKRA